MSNQPGSQTSIQSISLKFTQSNLPSSSFIKLSQDHISLTYTVSLQNVSFEKLEFPQIHEMDDLSTSIQRDTICVRNNQNVRKNFAKEKDHQHEQNKDVFKKKPLLKISNLDISLLLEDSKLDHKNQTPRPRKSFIRSNNSGLFLRNKNIHDVYHPKTVNKIKDIFSSQPSDNMETSSLLRTSRFYSIKNDSQTARKVNFSVKKQLEKRIMTCDTQRKYNRFPLIKGSNFHSSAPASLNKNKKIRSTHENAQACDKFIFGKTCVLRQNDEKAKKYLQKVIQTRSNTIHFSDNKKNRIFKDYNQDLQDW